MSAGYLQAIDWTRPWLAPYRQLGETLSSVPDWRSTANGIASGIRNSRGFQIEFVPQSALPDGMPYESFIARTGQVPSRENLHDFFNALVWLTFPRIKVQLNARQAEEIDFVEGVLPARGRVRDAATLFDENAALLVVRDMGLLEMLRTHQWQEVFVRHRARFSEHVEVVLFGHALMEKLVAPYKAITAHAWPVVTDETSFRLTASAHMRQLDKLVADALCGPLSPALFSPLPVLGIPEWWPVQDAEFYADAAVFRPKPSRGKKE